MRNENKIKGLTIVELLTVLAIIALLIGLLLPAISGIVNKGKEVKQRAQFATISIALETFRNDFGDYPESHYKKGASDNYSTYCGAQILAEALVGFDLFGVHPKTDWNEDGKINNGADVYQANPVPAGTYNGKQRKGPYIEPEKAGAMRLDTDSFVTPSGDGLYTGATNFSTSLSGRYVLTDSYKRTYNFDIDGDGTADTVKSGMPILYYKARANKYKLDKGTQDDSIFDFRHNKALTDSDVPWKKNQANELNEDIFYNTGTGADLTDKKYITNPAISNTTDKIPYNKDSFILISAGKDGLYGTADDIFNFEKE